MFHTFAVETSRIDKYKERVMQAEKLNEYDFITNDDNTVCVIIIYYFIYFY
jgi:hypothetical protein